jgi:hypothetical protein
LLGRPFGPTWRNGAYKHRLREQRARIIGEWLQTEARFRAWMISVTPFFEFVLVAVGIGSFAILLTALLWWLGSDARRPPLPATVDRRRSDFGSPYHAGRSAHWLKIKNSAAPVVRRPEEEDWSA